MPAIRPTFFKSTDLKRLIQLIPPPFVLFPHQNQRPDYFMFSIILIFGTLSHPLPNLVSDAIRFKKLIVIADK